MDDLILEWEGLTRLCFFIGGALLFALLEKLFPKKSFGSASSMRRLSNVGLTLINSLALRLLFPILAIQMAFLAEAKGWGLFNGLGFIPPIISGIICFFVLDFIIYWQHRLFHLWNPFWRLHRVHHSDTQFDMTTALRFHTIEISLSMVIKILFILVLGAPALSVLVFEIVLNFSSLFNHSNWNIGSIDRQLRKILVTPDMHRVHHSINSHEYNSNFGFNFSIWDRIFKTYRQDPAAGHDAMTIGLDRFREQKDQRLDQLLIQPFH